MSRKLITYKDACEMLGIKKTLLHELIKFGILDRRAMPVPGRKRPVNRIAIESIESYQQGGHTLAARSSTTLTPRKWTLKPARQLSRQAMQSAEVSRHPRTALQFVGH